MRRKEDVGVVLNGDKQIKCGVSHNLYSQTHTWLRRKFGPATVCEGVNCSGVSNKYEYALLKGRSYEKKRGNFIMLCHSCHVKYDWDESKRKYMRVMAPETRKKIGMAQIGRKRSEEEKQRMSLLMSGEGNPMYGVKRFGAENQFYGKKHSDESKKKMFEAAAQLTKEQVTEIRDRHRAGEQQKDIAAAFGLNKPRVCKIVNHQIYKSW